ncbi:unnamed protein product [Phytophthora fragariaefolia]|uniref:Unnamed protein product n=1 Tax=Phytophthora fragariaefolia TaxID=1490495 RepID=A0A9W6YK28_9STRA|nr:unnamed protein product [Phytophthora fragariaefolia]
MVHPQLGTLHKTRNASPGTIKMTTKRAEVLLGSGNYFHWEYNMRMMLARKGLLAHVQEVKVESEITEAWLVNDAKALGIIAQGVELQHQTKICSATRAIQAWGTLRAFYNRTTLHNRVTMTRRLHEFKMDDGASMAKHLDAIDELVVGLQTMGEPVDEARQLVVLLNSLPVEYELISSIIENAKDITLIEVKEKLLNGATAHMTPHRSDLLEYEGLGAGMEVTIADSKKLTVAGQGTVRLLGLDQKRIKMVDVLHIRGLDRRLLSAGKLAKRGLKVEFQRSSCVIWGNASAIASGKKVGKAYVLDCDQEEARFVQYAGADSQWELWHARMGHPNKDALIETQRATNGIPAVGQAFTTLCGGCMKGKQTVAAFPSRSGTKTSRVLELVHTDVMGPMKTPSKGGAKYVLTFVDDFSRYVVAYFLKKKSEVASKLKEFMRFYEKQWGERLMCLRSDNGTEYVIKDVTRICTLNGIMHQRTVPYSPQQNGVAERMNRTIMEKARSMLHYKGVPTEWWAEAVSTAVYLINRSTNTLHTTVTPYELGFKVKPTLEHLRVFGSHGYAHIDKAKRTKLEPKSFRCMFLGYAENVKGYRVFDLDASKVKVVRSVKLDEREVDSIYETQPVRNGTVVHLSKDAHDVVVPAPVERQPVVEEPMEGVENDAPDEPMESTEPEQDSAPPLLLAEVRPSPTGLELAPYRGTEIRRK